MFCFAKITGEILRSASKCVIAARYGIGVDNIDIPVCTELGIVVTNVPDYCIEEVVDHTIGMIFALNHRIVQDDRAVKLGGWINRASNRSVLRISDSVLGIIGFGRIGRAVAKRAAGFGMRIIAHDPVLQEGQEVEDGVRIVSLDTVIGQSDFITVHIPLTDDTYHIIGKDELSGMKPGAILINCARGGLVDEIALTEMLESGHLGGAGLDVLEDVGVLPSYPLLQCDNLIVTPHTAFFSNASSLELQTRTAEEVIRVVNGKYPNNIINPEVIGRSRVKI